MRTRSISNHAHTLDQADLAVLACPVCHGALVLGVQQEIACTVCSRRYPIRDGLPVLLASAALA